MQTEMSQFLFKQKKVYKNSLLKNEIEKIKQILMNNGYLDSLINNDIILQKNKKLHMLVKHLLYLK